MEGFDDVDIARHNQAMEAELAAGIFPEHVGLLHNPKGEVIKRIARAEMALEQKEIYLDLVTKPILDFLVAKHLQVFIVTNLEDGSLLRLPYHRLEWTRIKKYDELMWQCISHIKELW